MGYLKQSVFPFLPLIFRLMREKNLNRIHKGRSAVCLRSGILIFLTPGLIKSLDRK
jgi:hypothetical protein